MLDITPTLSSKGSQLNADDLRSGDKIIKITKVDLNLNVTDQPLTIHFQGENGMPFKPSLTVRRILSQLWGADGNQWRGRQLRLFCDPDVTFGGKKVGGIRIRAASHIEKTMSFSVKSGRGKRGVAHVEPLQSSEPTSPTQQQDSSAKTEPKAKTLSVEEAEGRFIEKINHKDTVSALEALTNSDQYKRFMVAARKQNSAIAERVSAAVNQKLEQLQSIEPPDYWPEEEMPA